MSCYCIRTYQTLINKLHGPTHYKICDTCVYNGDDGLDCHVITTEYRTHVHCIHM